MKINDIKEMIKDAEQERQRVWDKQANEGLKVKDNLLPLQKKMGDEKYWVDNWLLKCINWMISMLSSSDISVELKDINNVRTLNMTLMEKEVNFHMDYFQWTEVAEKAKSDRYFTGMGIIKILWNPFRINDFFQTGIPVFSHIDSRKFYLDPNPTTTRYLFQKEEYTKKALLNHFPEYQELKKLEDNKTHNVFIFQHKETKTIQKVACYIEDQDEIRYFDWDDYQKEIENGFVVPEGIEIAGPVKSEEDIVTEYIYVEGIDKFLKEEVIGDDFTYTRLQSIPFTDSPYSPGLPYFLMDMQDISITLMTILVLQTLKNHKQTKIYYPEAIKNIDKIKGRMHLPGIEIEIDPDFELTHPNQKPIEFLSPPKFGNEFDYLDQRVQNVIKTTTGVTDTLLANSYNDMAGVAIAQFQTAAKVYHKKDYVAWINFIQDNVTCLMKLITQYRNYKHKIMGINEEGVKTLIDVAVDEETMLNHANYIVLVIIEENQDALKQIEREFAMKLYSMGVIDEEDLLEKMPFKNIDRIIEKFKQRKQEQLEQQAQEQAMQNNHMNMGGK